MKEKRYFWEYYQNDNLEIWQTIPQAWAYENYMGNNFIRLFEISSNFMGLKWECSFLNVKNYYLSTKITLNHSPNLA